MCGVRDYILCEVQTLPWAWMLYRTSMLHKLVYAFPPLALIPLTLSRSWQCANINSSRLVYYALAKETTNELLRAQPWQISPAPASLPTRPERGGPPRSGVDSQTGSRGRQSCRRRFQGEEHRRHLSRERLHTNAPGVPGVALPSHTLAPGGAPSMPFQGVWVRAELPLSGSALIHTRLVMRGAPPLPNPVPRGLPQLDLCLFWH